MCYVCMYIEKEKKVNRIELRVRVLFVCIYMFRERGRERDEI